MKILLQIVLFILLPCFIVAGIVMMMWEILKGFFSSKDDYISLDDVIKEIEKEQLEEKNK